MLKFMMFYNGRWGIYQSVCQCACLLLHRWRETSWLFCRTWPGGLQSSCALLNSSSRGGAPSPRPLHGRPSWVGKARCHNVCKSWWSCMVDFYRACKWSTPLPYFSRRFFLSHSGCACRPPGSPHLLLRPQLICARLSKLRHGPTHCATVGQS